MHIRASDVCGRMCIFTCEHVWIMLIRMIMYVYKMYSTYIHIYIYIYICYVFLYVYICMYHLH